MRGNDDVDDCATLMPPRRPGPPDQMLLMSACLLPLMVVVVLEVVVLGGRTPSISPFRTSFGSKTHPFRLLMKTMVHCCCVLLLLSNAAFIIIASSSSESTVVSICSAAPPKKLGRSMKCAAPNKDATQVVASSRCLGMNGIFLCLLPSLLVVMVVVVIRSDVF